MAQKETFDVTGMSCAACANTVQRVLANQKGVHKAEVNFATATATVEFEEVTSEALQNAVSAIGYGLSPADKKKV